MNVLKRIVSTKRHTVGYLVSGMGRITRTSAVKLARSSRLNGVRIMNGPNGAYLVSNTSRSLYNLPIIIDRDAVRSDATKALSSSRQFPSRKSPSCKSTTRKSSSRKSTSSRSH